MSAFTLPGRFQGLIIFQRRAHALALYRCCCCCCIIKRRGSTSANIAAHKDQSHTDMVSVFSPFYRLLSSLIFQIRHHIILLLAIAEAKNVSLLCCLSLCIAEAKNVSLLCCLSLCPCVMWLVFGGSREGGCLWFEGFFQGFGESVLMRLLCLSVRLTSTAQCLEKTDME